MTEFNCKSCGKNIDAENCPECIAEKKRQHLIRRPPYIKENRFGGDLIEYGVVAALFDDIPAAGVSVTSGAQTAFNAAREFIKGISAYQCNLAGCKLSGKPYGEGDEHTMKCWFGYRKWFYSEEAKAERAKAYEEQYGKTL